MRRSTLAFAAAALTTLVSAPDVAARAIRPLFEPTDLEMEDTGVAEIDLQIGFVRSQGPWRLVLPDFELDLGILPWLELDLDGAYALEGPQNGPFSLDHAAPDALWPSVKLGLYDSHDANAKSGRAIGAQIGPKLPVAAGSHGIGVEGLLLLGGSLRRLQLVLNIGGFVDPAPDAVSSYPIGIETGVDMQLKLDDVDRFSLTAEVSGVYFLTADPNQFLVTSGITWSVLPTLDLSIVGLYGLLVGSDRYGVLFGISPKLRMFHG
jgi:hypothetical protein